MQEITYIGKGWHFPPRFSLGGKEVQMSTGVQGIKESLEILFGTRLHERIMREDYGASLVDYQFEGISPGLITRLKNTIEQAILRYEVRINLNEVVIKTDHLYEGFLNIYIDFTMPESNSRYNMVYPFYLTEGNP